MKSKSQHFVRPAAAKDLGEISRLAAIKRTRGAAAQPVFWRPAENADEIHVRHLEKLIAEPDTFAYVCGHENSIRGFMIANLVAAPPVYDPGGKTLMIDDFVVDPPELWIPLGSAMLKALTDRLQDQNVVQAVVVCGHHDDAKRELLQHVNATMASEWWHLAL